jgi:hypothetical protein
MKPEICIPFLQNKIQGIGSALFYSLSSAVLKFPTSIVSTLKVDEMGNIWFFANRPEQHLAEFDWEFPAQMQFYRKGKGYYLQVTGKACIVNDPEEVNSLVGLPEETRAKAFRVMVLIKVQINHANYYEYTNLMMPKNSMKRLLSRLHNWLFATPAQPRIQLQPSPRLGF